MTDHRIQFLIHETNTGRFGWVMEWPLGNPLARSTRTWASERGCNQAIVKLISRMQARGKDTAPVIRDSIDTAYLSDHRGPWIGINERQANQFDDGVPF